MRDPRIALGVVSTPSIWNGKEHQGTPMCKRRLGRSLDMAHITSFVSIFMSRTQSQGRVGLQGRLTSVTAQEETESMDLNEQLGESLCPHMLDASQSWATKLEGCFVPTIFLLPVG